METMAKVISVFRNGLDSTARAFQIGYRGDNTLHMLSPNICVLFHEVMKKRSADFEFFSKCLI